MMIVMGVMMVMVMLVIMAMMVTMLSEQWAGAWSRHLAAQIPNLGDGLTSGATTISPHRHMTRRGTQESEQRTTLRTQNQDPMNRNEKTRHQAELP